MEYMDQQWEMGDLTLEFALEFANASLGAGFGPSVSLDGFYDPYAPTNRGGGLTIGAGVGGGFSVQATNTVVTPNTLTWRDFVPGWMKPNSNLICR